MIIHTLSERALLYMRRQSLAAEVAYTEFRVSDADCDELCTQLDKSFAGQYEIIPTREEPSNRRITRYAWEKDRHGHPILNFYDDTTLVAYVGRTVGMTNRVFSKWHYGVVGAYRNFESKSIYGDSEVAIQALKKSKALAAVLVKTTKKEA